MVLLVSSEACYFAHINKESEVSHSRRIALSEVNKIEIECLQAVADTVRNAKQEATGANLPIHAEKRQCSRFMTGIWNLLRLFLQLLVTTIKTCRLRSRKVDTSAGDLVEESSNAPETPELRGDIPLIIEPQELDALHPADQEVGHGRVTSMRDSMATLQVSHDTDTEGPSGSSWLTEGNYELISLKSTSSASTLWTTSSFSSDQDSSEDELSQTRNSPDVCQLRETTWLGVPSAHRAFLVEGREQPSQQQPALLSVPGPQGTQGEPGPEVPAFAGAGSPWASPLPLAHLGQRR
ncbi:uncharacterized protein LOC132390823 [Hypanus sabinus]|uniref:uncharacterized protein LOC132390823 n=1 Tax=Hypanus sabinus TaxID=79690 RepID=UPI0028C50771|nr:uncharacterized protein LOC132390823 [Hypanus sabinus]